MHGQFSRSPGHVSRVGKAKRRYAIWLGVAMFLRQIDLYVFRSVFRPGNEARIGLAPGADRR